VKKLILIRHGKTDYTEKQKYCGHENIPLNNSGVEQANRLRVRLKRMKIDTVYASDLSRASQTAEIAFPKRRILKRARLREIDFGQFSGFTFEQVGRMYPDIYKAWLNNPADARIPDGESLAGFAKRINDCFERICKQNPKRAVAIVAHGGPIRIILLSLLKKGLEKFWDIEQHAAAINIAEFKNGMPKILKINDTSYLS